MKKPHEEDWEVSGHSPAILSLPGRGMADFDSGDTSGRDAARAKLAAQAPAMARLLLEMLEPETHVGDPVKCAQERLAWALNFEPRLRETLRAAGVIE